MELHMRSKAFLECLPLSLSPSSFRRRILLSQHNKRKINARSIKCGRQQSFFGGNIHSAAASAYCNYTSKQEEMPFRRGRRKAAMSEVYYTKGKYVVIRKAMVQTEARPGPLFYISLRTTSFRQRSRDGCQPKEGTRTKRIGMCSLISRAS